MKKFLTPLQNAASDRKPLVDHIRITKNMTNRELTMNDKLFLINLDQNQYSIYLPDSETDHIQKQIAHSKSPYEKDMLYSMLEQSSEGDLILDIGANIGNHAIFLAHHGRNVIAFEPNKTLFNSIERSVEVNSLQERLQVLNCAIGSQNETGALIVSNLQNLGQGKIKKGEGEVKIFSLDHILKGSIPRSIKIDVEGMEEEVLKGAQGIIQNAKPDIYVEISSIESLEAIIEKNYLINYVYVETYNATPTHLFVHKTRLPAEAVFLEVSATKSFPLMQDKSKIVSKGKMLITDKAALERSLADEKKRGQQTVAALVSEKASLELTLADEKDKGQQKVEALVAEKTSLERALANEKKHGQQRIAVLTSEKATLERLLNEEKEERIFIERKLRDRLKKIIKIGLVIGAPVLILISPVILLILVTKNLEKIYLKRHVNKKHERQISNSSTDACASSTEKPTYHESPEQLNQLYAKPCLGQLQGKKSGPMASIIIPSFNNEAFLAQAINSVLMQSYRNLEAIVVDDGSTDRSLSIAIELAKADHRVKIVPLVRNFGCYYARNIGVMHSKGEYIGICDSDDILSPNFLEKSINALNQSPKLMACQSRVRRWTKDFSAPISSLRFGENTVLWKRFAIRDIGWYDTTRFGSDTEFRTRLIAFYGKSALARIPDETYYARTLEGSLTMSNESQAHTLQDGQLGNSLSPVRKRYVDNFTSWHSRFDSEQALKFPQLKRNFDLGDAVQNASPSLGQNCIGAMASFPKRIESLRVALPPLLEQFDRIYLYLNEYERIPDFCVHPKIAVTLGTKGHGDLRDNGKFYNLPFDGNSYIFTLDDDIIYPEDYTRKMIHYIEVFSRKSVVGVHGVNFPKGSFSNLKHREVFHFKRQSYGGFVDLLGTGTIAWHNSILQPTLDDFRTKGVCDLWFARLAALTNVSLFSVPREDNWLRSIGGNEGSLFEDARSGLTSFFDVYDKFYAPILMEKQLRQNSIDQLKKTYSESTINALFGEFWLGDRDKLSAMNQGKA